MAGAGKAGTVKQGLVSLTKTFGFTLTEMESY